MKKIMGILFSIVIILPHIVFAQNSTDLGGGRDNNVSQSGCFEEYTCTCNEESFESVQTIVAPATTDIEASQLCNNACADRGIEGTWEIYCDGKLMNHNIISSTVVPPPQATKPVKVPGISIPLPGLTAFTPGVNADGTITTNYIGQYVQALYKFMIAIASIGVVLTIMIAGMKWMVARGDSGAVSKAKESISKAITALFILLSVVAIVNLLDPQLSIMKGLTLPVIEELEIASTDGDEGSTGTADAKDCAEAVREAKIEGACTLTEKILSPTNGAYSCNYHFKKANYNYEKIKALDYIAPFGTELIAPFSGTVSYAIGAGDRCGNKIRLIGDNGGSITLCHVKDFLDSFDTTMPNNTHVSQGDVIGHSGGLCCSGENPPGEWSQSGKCIGPGTPCADPTKPESCTCQPYQQSGNTSGPHVHLTFNSGGDLLACLQ